MKINARDLRLDTFSWGIPGVNGGAEVKVTHIPSCMTASCTGPSQLRAKELALEALQESVDEFYGEAVDV